MGPDYERPDVITPEEFRGPMPTGESVANVPWWELYQDPVLQDLIQTALENNRSVRQAFARINEFRASLRIAQAGRYPSVTGFGVAFRQETESSDSTRVFDNAKAAVSVGYEIDLWGKAARSNEAALQGLLATEEAYRTLTIGLVSDVAATYLVMRDVDARLDIALATVETRQESLALLSARAEGGLVATVDVNRAEVDLADAETMVQKLTRARAQTENGLSLLLGQLPSDVARGSSLSDQTFPPDVPAGLPSELLQRRPDVLAAERQLHAQTARIGVAQAARFPSLSLTASGGVKSSSLGEITASNSFLNIGANLFAPIFDAGGRKARVEVERARTEQLLNQYEQVILNAFREVEDALVAVETYRMEHEIRLRQRASAQEGLEVAQALYDGGLSSYMEVLDLQRAVFGTALMVSETLQLHHSSVVQLYRALGGGWTVEVGAEGEDNLDSVSSDAQPATR
jgi:multidrug efflux system outer membrane protein